jgi:U3 small nucleolar RNA-associated protein 3
MSFDFFFQLLSEHRVVHASRDKILLEGEHSDGGDDGDEDEVFALKGVDESDADETDEGEDEDDAGGDEDMAEEVAPKKKVSKAKTRRAAIPSSSSEDSEEEETWGRNKSAYYSSNAAQLDSDDEEANELEEQEAKRLQAKAREGMLEDDFGLGDVHIVGEGKIEE